MTRDEITVDSSVANIERIVLDALNDGQHIVVYGTYPEFAREWLRTHKVIAQLREIDTTVPFDDDEGGPLLSVHTAGYVKWFEDFRWEQQLAESNWRTPALVLTVTSPMQPLALSEPVNRELRVLWRRDRVPVGLRALDRTDPDYQPRLATVG